MSLDLHPDVSVSSSSHWSRSLALSSFRGPRHRLARLAVPAFTAALTLAIFGPLLRSGTVLLLDYGDFPVGPRSTLGAYAWGFPPGLTSRAPIVEGLLELFRVLPWGPLRLLPLMAVPWLAAWGFSRLLHAHPGPVIAATTLFVVNPFVYDRMLAGQVYLLLGYALFPLLLSSLFSRAGTLGPGLVGGLLFAVQMALSPHFLFLTGLLLAGLALASIASHDRGPAARAGTAALIAGAISVYWVVPALSQVGRLSLVGPADLRAFQTLGDSRFGLVANVTGLYGFWRSGWPLSKDAMPLWPMLLAALVAAIGVGAWVSLRRRRTRPLAIGLGTVAVLALFLSLGAKGPTAFAFDWAFAHVPGFRIMREPQKFLGLTALVYACGLGAAARAFSREARSRWAKGALVALLVALPCIYTFRMFWGFAGYVRPSLYPVSWAAADRVMGAGPGDALSLPFDAYLPFPWTQERSVANPMASYFRRQVLVAPDPGLDGLPGQATDPRSRYLGFVLSPASRVRDVGNLLSPLGIRYVLLSKVADWRAYLWLDRQRDLRRVGTWNDLELYENLAPSPVAYAPTAAVSLADWGQLIGFAANHRLTAYAINVQRAGPGPIRPGPERAIPATTRPITAAAMGPAKYRLGKGASGPFVILSQPYQPTWSLEGARAQPNFGVTLLFRGVPASETSVATFGRWGLVRAFYLMGAIVTALVLAVCCVQASRRHGAVGLSVQAAKGWPIAFMTSERERGYRARRHGGGPD